MIVFMVLTGTTEKNFFQNLEVDDVEKVDSKDKNKIKKQIREDFTTTFKWKKY